MGRFFFRLTATKYDDFNGGYMKIALVTGAGAGIGKAIAYALAQQQYCVGVLDIDPNAAATVAREITLNRGWAVSLTADVSDRAQVRAALAVLRQHGPIQILINNAGITALTPFKQIDDAHWDAMLNVNLSGPFILCQEVLGDMEAAEWGRIINISSTSVLTGVAQMAHYTASKGGLIALTRSLALELGPSGITVNNVAPGSVLDTVMSEEHLTQMGTSREAMESRLPVRRVGVPEDIANAVTWLCSDASGYITGQTIAVNGGRALT